MVQSGWGARIVGLPLVAVVVARVARGGERTNCWFDVNSVVLSSSNTGRLRPQKSNNDQCLHGINRNLNTFLLTTNRQLPPCNP